MVYLWDIASGQLLQQLETGINRDIANLTFSADGQTIAEEVLCMGCGIGTTTTETGN